MSEKPTAKMDRLAPLASPVSGVVFEGRVARVHRSGDPLRYPTGPEYRDEAELAAMVPQAADRVVTLLHPSKLISEGAEPRVIGSILSARVDGDFLVARFLVSDPEGLAAIRDGMHELSLGYLVGRLDSARFQRDIVLDHLALVPRARCGEACALRADHMDCDDHDDLGNVTAEDSDVSITPTPCACKKLANSSPGRYSGPKMSDVAVTPEPAGLPAADPKKDYAMDELRTQLAAAIADAANQRARADALFAELSAEKTARETFEIAAHEAQKDLQVEKTRADSALAEAQAAADKARNDSATEVEARVLAKVALIAEATPILGAVDPKLTEREIKLAVISKVDGDDESTRNDGFVDGCYSGAVKRAARAKSSVIETRAAIVTMRKDGAESVVKTGSEAEAAAKKNQADALAQAWKTPTPTEK